ncbi:hypothetical protein BLS_004635 [Venturia inaequalis]|uniref:Uncharacterized protein n=1 Tax=Venturia inaequalis TaxID=5025 RepID=A0A8H3UAY3_VENIN|nr:hypothetical protein EG328_008403 [Venturia inaequalis]KAE9971068.1 hypothetical protein BLS_004635 [Venturia inaequalis]KAE9990816.1 hypothetical protein EG327_000907 [Venturia inaequalis]
MTSPRHKTEIQLRNERIEANSIIIWGLFDYRFDLVSPDGPGSFQIFVKKELAHKSECLIKTIFCEGSEEVWNELDRMLGAWASQKQSGQEMTEGESLDIFGVGLDEKSKDD